MRACGSNSLVVYFTIKKTHAIWEGNMKIRSEIQTKNIHSLGFREKKRSNGIKHVDTMEFRVYSTLLVLFMVSNWLYTIRSL